MSEKIKTSILIDKGLWNRFRRKASIEKGLKSLSEAMEKALEEELADTLIVKALEEMISPRSPAYRAIPIKPRAKTKAEDIVHEMRRSRIDSIS
ncbi:MAG: hypothetical protein ACUVTD_08840 [Nitrososphaerales archaeon]